MENNINIEECVADTILEKPHVFYIGERQFYLYPETLGIMYITKRFIKKLNMYMGIAARDPYIEALRVCTEKKDIASRIIAYHCMKSKEDVFNEKKIIETSTFISDNTTIEELTQLLILVLSEDNIDTFIKHFDIDRERKERERINKIKKNGGNTITFGGKTIYGTLIDYACERYGWTLEYVVWGISYANLKMLMLDAITPVYLTDEEKKKAHIPTDRTFINGDDISIISKIKSMCWD